MFKEIVIAGTMIAVGATAAVAHPDQRQAHRRSHAVQSVERIAEWLELTPQQVETLKALREDRRETRREFRQRLAASAVEYRDLRDAGDPGAARAFERFRALRDEGLAMRLAARADFERVLTQEQREKIQQRRRQRR